MANKFSVVTYSKSKGKPPIQPKPNVDFDEEQEKQANIIKIIEKFTAKICRSFSDKMVEATRKNHKYCLLFKYNDDPERGELLNETIDGVSTKKILSGSWIPDAKRYFHSSKCRSVGHRISEYISDAKFNNGIDIVTKQKYNVAIFHYKNKDSVFPNGIIISRDGINYK